MTKFRSLFFRLRVINLTLCFPSFLTPIPSHRPGLSPSIHSIDQIKVVDRFRGTPAPYAYISGFGLGLLN